MLLHRTAVAVGIVALVTSQSAPAQAQGLTTCAEILWEFVGKPLTGVMVEKGGGLLFDYFADRLKTQPHAVVTPNDIRNLTQEYEQRGSSECALRQQFEAMYGGAPNGPIPPRPTYPSPPGYEPSGQGYQERTWFSAEAFCPITGAVGFARGQPDPQQAIYGAIANCISRGGVPQCCEHNAHLVQ